MSRARSSFQRISLRFLLAAAAAFSIATGSAVAEDALTQLGKGLMYYHGKGVPEDEVKALEWFKRSAGQGNTDAMYYIGNIFAFGAQAHRVSPDPDIEAARWYFEAARAGHADAQYALGLMFLSGKGVVQSPDEGLAWIRIAAARGHSEAEGFVSVMEGSPR